MLESGDGRLQKKVPCDLATTSTGKDHRYRELYPLHDGNLGGKMASFDNDFHPMPFTDELSNKSISNSSLPSLSLLSLQLPAVN